MELMKCIVAIIAFEVFKNKADRSNRIDLDDYTIPHPLNEIYLNFNSLSYKARRAMREVFLYYYVNCIKLGKQKFFDMSEGYENYKGVALRFSEGNKEVLKALNIKK